MSELRDSARHLVVAGRGRVIADASVAQLLAAETIVALLGERGVPFFEVSAHRATLEEAYMELTRDAVEFRATAPEVAR
jgi:ABC-2 type transport system ATP-binding protein